MIVGLARADPGAAFLVVAVAIAVAVVVYLASRGALQRFLATCDRVAGRLGGRREGGDTWSEPEIHFRIDGLAALIQFSGGKHPSTKVSVALRGKSPGAFKLVPHNFGQGLLKLFGAQDIDIGDPAFDQDYVIKANPESLARSIFRADRRREGIEAVRRVERHPGLRVELTAEALSVQVARKLEMEEEILELAETAVDFTGYVVETPRDVGIQWVEGSSTSTGRCQVCGSELLERVVRCASCRTPHHRECWEYARECSTFACRERRFV